VAIGTRFPEVGGDFSSFFQRYILWFYNLVPVCSHRFVENKKKRCLGHGCFLETSDIYSSSRPGMTSAKYGLSEHGKESSVLGLSLAQHILDILPYVLAFSPHPPFSSSSR